MSAWQRQELDLSFSLIFEPVVLSVGQRTHTVMILDIWEQGECLVQPFHCLFHIHCTFCVNIAVDLISCFFSVIWEVMVAQGRARSALFPNECKWKTTRWQDNYVCISIPNVHTKLARCCVHIHLSRSIREHQTMFVSIKHSG